MALFGQDRGVQNKVVSQNPVFSEEQQASNPLLKKFSKGKKGKEENVSRSSISSSSTQATTNPSNFQTMTNNHNVTSHPLSNHPYFKSAINRLCPTLVNLMDTPGKIDLKPYWKEAFVKKGSFDGCEMKEKIEDGILKVILTVYAVTTEMQFKMFRNKGFDVTNSPIKYGS